MEILRKQYSRKRKGDSTLFNNQNYEVYEFWFNKKIGYKIRPKMYHRDGQKREVETMYFVYEKKGW